MQYNFSRKINNTKNDDALMKEILNLCLIQQGTNLTQYYRNILENNSNINITERRLRLQISESTAPWSYVIAGLLGLPTDICYITRVWTTSNGQPLQDGDCPHIN